MMKLNGRVGGYFEDNMLLACLAGSVVLHALFLILAFVIYRPDLVRKRIPIKIVYRQAPRLANDEDVTRAEKIEKFKSVQKSESAHKSASSEKILNSALFKDAGGPSAAVLEAKKQAVRMISSSERRSISVPSLTTQKITNPQYIGYDARIREKIRNRAYFYIEDPQFQAGEVYLTFVLQSDGTLKDLQVIDAKTRANDYLRQAGLRSIRESSPFPAFPPELKYPELSFNVVISFEVNE